MKKKIIFCFVTLLAAPSACKKADVSDSDTQASGVGGVGFRTVERNQGTPSLTRPQGLPENNVRGGLTETKQSSAKVGSSSPASSQSAGSIQDYKNGLNTFAMGNANAARVHAMVSASSSHASSAKKTSPEFQKCLELGNEIDSLSLASTTFAVTHEEMARVQPHIEARKKLVVERKSLFNGLATHEKIKLAGRDFSKNLGHSMMFGSAAGAAVGVLAGAMVGLKMLVEPNVSVEKKLLGLLGYPVAGVVVGGLAGSVAIPGTAIMLGYAGIHKILEKGGFLPGGKHYDSLKPQQQKISDSFHVTQSLWETPVTNLTATHTAPTSQEWQNILNTLNNPGQ